MSDTASLHDEPFDAPVTAGEVVFSGRVWDVRRDAFTYGEATLTREYVAHTGAVAVVAVDADDRVLLIQQYRHPVRRRDWEIPAGLLDVPGEEHLAAAQRELAEEADIEAADWEPLISVFTTPGGSDEVIDVYLARGLRATATPFPREAEEADIRREWVPMSEVADAVLAGRMGNGILVSGVLAAAERLRRERAGA